MMGGEMKGSGGRECERHDEEEEKVMKRIRTARERERATTERHSLKRRRNT